MHTGEPVKIMCPVCTGTLCDQLSNEQRVIEEQICHYNDENEGFTLEKLHPQVICSGWHLRAQVDVRNATIWRYALDSTSFLKR